MIDIVKVFRIQIISLWCLLSCSFTLLANHLGHFSEDRIEESGNLLSPNCLFDCLISHDLLLDLLFHRVLIKVLKEDGKKQVKDKVLP